MRYKTDIISVGDVPNSWEANLGAHLGTPLWELIYINEVFDKDDMQGSWGCGVGGPPLQKREAIAVNDDDSISVGQGS